MGVLLLVGPRLLVLVRKVRDGRVEGPEEDEGRDSDLQPRVHQLVEVLQVWEVM